MKLLNEGVESPPSRVAGPQIPAAEVPLRFPFVRPRLPALQEVEAEFSRARQSNFYSNFGPSSLHFERLLEVAYFPGMSAVACANCTVGLSAALIALRVNRPVLYPAFTFPATAAAIRGAGLAAVVGDVDPLTGVLDAALADELIARYDIGAVIAVRPYGIWTDIGALGEVCRRHGVPLVIDNAAGIGVDRAVVERFAVEGAMELFSLHATKPFGVGEGGVAVVPPAHQHNLRSALNFGLWALGDLQPGEGLNGKMDELTASMAIAVFHHLAARLAERRAMAARYNALAQAAGLGTFVAPGEEERSPWQCFALRLPDGVDPERVLRACRTSGLLARRYYYPTVGLGIGAAHVPNAAALSARAVCLPVYDGEDAGSADEIWSIFHEALARAGGGG
ncbi:DegT/DnrJ/EryC1/StrS family aminotransferase [Ancylobacter sp. MQZ15Z-1]|uniref:DegT/DnrJ/EryC1/StrS family aminotransferase n=1 Tax=Ancylobacter mangrovi TaxID=2972472 RepID=A0A9X2PCN1_9HYPH|nr:DegT/DnrJ/EryC1/StrS family aminotransferase [Ancylobacter mangrovi]MCS0495490.1 DegT/DnrJ/EryC1/StrS family aminotransferase [Ancylobacter mangrovi]